MSSSDDQTEQIMDDALADWRDPEMSLVDFVQARGVMAPLLAMFTVTVSAIMGFGEAIMRPVSAVLSGIADVIDATFGESIQIIAAGARQAAWSVEHGVVSLFGPFAYPIAIATVISGLWVLAWWWERTEWNPFGFLFDRFG